MTARFGATPPGDLARAQHDVRARDLARENRRVLVRADLDVFAREQHLQLLLQRRDRLLDHDVVLRCASRRPHTIRLIVPGVLPSMRISRGCDHRRVGDGRVGDRDAGHVEVGRQDGRTAGGQRHLWNRSVRRLWLRAAVPRGGCGAGALALAPGSGA